MHDTPRHFLINTVLSLLRNSENKFSRVIATPKTSALYSRHNSYK
jgi:hypothetical protein